MVGGAGLCQDPHRVVRPAQEARVSDGLGRADGPSSVLPGPDLLDDGLLYDLLLLLLDLFWVTEYQTVVDLLFLLFREWFLIENIGVAISELFTVDDVLGELCPPALSDALLGFSSRSRCKVEVRQTSDIKIQLTEPSLYEVNLLITIISVDIFLIQNELTAR